MRQWKVLHLLMLCLMLYFNLSGGLAKYYIEIATIADMQEVILFCNQSNIDYIVIGKGSNCLFDDRGFDGCVIVNKITFCQIEETEVFVGAGYSFSLLGVQTAKRGLSGLEFASGIPASVGGAVYMNAGASHQETKDHLIQVHYVNESGALEVLDRNSLDFSYRSSTFQNQKGAIVAARFSLSPSEVARAKQLDIIRYRTRTQPYGDKSAGCVFRNPIEGSAGALIEHSGLKGLCLGAAQVSLLHANFIINQNDAKAEDILNLAASVQQRVKEHTGVELEMEIRCIPYQNKM
ncbi:MAG: UDP-N-acetylmuramate dehydrogenase [Chlamydiia bacterium]|nr:UDP-N-acetylmuramate dehydrogenase [Chlamydiia bacterium]